MERALLGVDALDQRRDLVGHEVVDAHRDAAPAGRVDELGGLLDRLGPVHLRALRARGAAGDVDGGAGGAELDRDAPPRGAGRPGDQRDLSGQRSGHHATEAISACGSA